MKKRFITAVLAMVLIVSQILSMSVTVTAGGVSEPADDTASDIFFEENIDDIFEGSGTKEDPFKVTSYKHFEYLSWATAEGNDFNGIYFKLMNDVDMDGYAHTPIGGETEYAYFSGYFDGNGKTVYNFGISKTAYNAVGLFGFVKNAVIRDLNIKGDINTDTYCFYGTVVGKAMNSEIINCAVESDIIIQGSRPVSKTTIYVGGIVGYIEDGGRVINCQYNGTINLIGRGDPQNGDFANRVALAAGGLIGRLDDITSETPNMTTSVENCIASGKIICESQSYHIFWGGLIGPAYNMHGINTNYPSEGYMLFVNNCIAEMDMDVSNVDMSNTREDFRGVRIGGIISAIHHRANVKIDNSHYVGQIKGLDNETFVQKNTGTYDGVMHGGILAHEYNVKNLVTNSTTSYPTLCWEDTSEFINCYTDVWDISSYKADVLATIQKGGVTDNYSGVAEEEDTSVYDVWDGKMAESFAGGNGTKEAPYLITNGGHLALMADAINNAVEVIDLGGLYFKVMNNIDMNGHPMEPIGGINDNYYFSGHFDGNNKIIKNLNLICDTDYEGDGEVDVTSRDFRNVGLFGGTKDAVIRDLTIKDMHMTDGITAQTYFNFGALIGKAVTTTVINCHVDSDITVECCKPKSQTTIYAGTLIGFMQDGGTVNGATYNGTFEVHGRGDNESESGNRVATVVGGLIGRVDMSYVNKNMRWNISNCIVSGKLQCVGTTYRVYVGGIVGVGFNDWGSDDNVQYDFMLVYISNAVVDADIDFSGIDFSKTSKENAVVTFGGILRSSGYYCVNLYNAHFIGNVIGLNNPDFYIVRYGGIVENPRADSEYNHVTTSMDRVTTNPNEGSYAENWKGKWDRSTCFVNDTQTGLNAIPGIMENIKRLSSYKDGYDSSKFNINDPFKSEETVEKPNIVVVGGNAMAGGKIEVYLNIDNNVGFSGLSIELIYDKNVFTLEDYYNDAYGTNMEVGQDKSHILWDNGGNYKSDILCTLVFSVADNVEGGNYSIGVNVAYAFDWEDNSVEIDTTSGIVTVSSFIYGDANGDKEVNGIDLIVLRQYLIGDVTSVSKGADANGDGLIDGRDINALRKYMIGEIELGPKQEVEA